MTSHHPPTHPVAASLQALLEQSRAFAALGQRATTAYLPGEPMPAQEALDLLGALTIVRQQLQQVEQVIGAEALPVDSYHGLALRRVHPRFVHGVQVTGYGTSEQGRPLVLLRDVEAPATDQPQTIPLREMLRQLRPWPQELARPVALATPAEAATPALPAKPAEAATPAEPVKPAAVVGGGPPAAASTGPAANGKAAPADQPAPLATTRQLDLIRRQLQDARITPSERQRVEARLAGFNRREASTCIETLDAWIKARGLTTPVPEPVAQGAIYHLYYRRQHASDRHLYLLCRRTYPQALSFAHAYELLLADLQQHQPLAAAQGFAEQVSLLAINGVPLEPAERSGHLEEATLDAVQELADSLDPPKVPIGQFDTTDPFLPA